MLLGKSHKYLKNTQVTYRYSKDILMYSTQVNVLPYCPPLPTVHAAVTVSRQTGPKHGVNGSSYIIAGITMALIKYKCCCEPGVKPLIDIQH